MEYALVFVYLNRKSMVVEVNDFYQKTNRNKGDSNEILWGENHNRSRLRVKILEISHSKEELERFSVDSEGNVQAPPKTPTMEEILEEKIKESSKDLPEVFSILKHFYKEKLTEEIVVFVENWAVMLRRQWEDEKKRMEKSKISQHYFFRTRNNKEIHPGSGVFLSRAEIDEIEALSYDKFGYPCWKKLVKKSLRLFYGDNLSQFCAKGQKDRAAIHPLIYSAVLGWARNYQNVLITNTEYTEFIDIICTHKRRPTNSSQSSTGSSCDQECKNRPTGTSRTGSSGEQKPKERPAGTSKTRISSSGDQVPKEPLTGTSKTILTLNSPPTLLVNFNLPQLSPRRTMVWRNQSVTPKTRIVQSPSAVPNLQSTHQKLNETSNDQLLPFPRIITSAASQIVASVSSTLWPDPDPSL